MGLFPQRLDKEKSLTCLVRGEKVIATPEEKVRQKLLLHLLEDLYFPKSLLSVEKSIEKNGATAAPQRRTDIIAYVKEKEQLLPLVLIECKAVKLNEKTIRQVQGYNLYVKAPYIAVANEKELQMGWREAKELRLIPYIPMYEQLTRSLRRGKSSHS